MNKTARLVLKLVAAGLAFAALVCLIVGSWSDVAEKCASLKDRMAKNRSEYDDYDDEALYEV